MKIVLIFVVMFAVACSSNQKPVPEIISIGISANASDFCNDILDDEIADLHGFLSPKAIACVKAKTYRMCGALMLEFVRNVERGGSAIEFKEPIKWGTEWCTADFMKDSAEEVDKRCEDFKEDMEVINNAVDEVMNTAITRIGVMTRAMGTSLKN